MSVVLTEIEEVRAAAGFRRAGRVLRRPGLVAGAIMLAGVAGALVVAPQLGLRDPLATDVPHRLAGFSWDHPLGTDGLGRDMLSRIVHGGRSSVALTMVVTIIATTLGVLFGVAAGFLGGIVDALVLRVIEVVQAVPLVIVTMVSVGLLGGGPAKLVLVLAILGWTGQARVVRAAALSLREREFVMAARANGASGLRIAWRHLVPNLLGPVVVLATLEVGRILLALSTLSFLGLGTRPPEPEWGSMLAEARTYFFVAPRLLIIPGMAIFVVTMATNLFGEGLRDAFEGRTARA